MDEFHTNQAVEYVGGSFSGTDVVNIVNVVNITKKLFCLMVKSSGGKYGDMVAMHPVATLTAEDMAVIFSIVLKGLTIAFILTVIQLAMSGFLLTLFGPMSTICHLNFRKCFNFDAVFFISRSER